MGSPRLRSRGFLGHHGGSWASWGLFRSLAEPLGNSPEASWGPFGGLFWALGGTWSQMLLPLHLDCRSLAHCCRLPIEMNEEPNETRYCTFTLPFPSGRREHLVSCKAPVRQASVVP
eukprot:6351131-Pyramimonas_sp.AAC.1